MGQKMMSFVRDFAVVNPQTFQILLKEPTGLVLQALGKPSSNVPFMMPRRVAGYPLPHLTISAGSQRTRRGKAIRRRMPSA